MLHYLLKNLELQFEQISHFKKVIRRYNLILREEQLIGMQLECRCKLEIINERHNAIITVWNADLHHKVSMWRAMLIKTKTDRRNHECN
jgi:hypothetical protein